MDVAERLTEVLAVLRPVWDVLEGRVVSTEPPDWCEARGWSAFLLALSDEQLLAAERLGLTAVLDPSAPRGLGELGERVHALVDPLRGGNEPPAPVETERVPARKRSQIASLLALVRAHWNDDIRRVVDFGAGHGHLTRALARGLGVPAVGIDRDPERVRTALELVDEDGPVFLVADGEGELALLPGDLVVGLHACGSLGDALVRRASAAGAQGLLVSCCLQKISGDRRLPLSRAARDLILPKAILGLTNLTYWDETGSVDDAMRGRCTRHALRLLLADRGAPVAAGEEAHGLNRRRFRAGLVDVAPEACVRRGLSRPTAAEIADYEARGEREHARIRRLTLPRTMLGRLVEYAVVLDRAAAFEERGYRVGVQPLFAAGLSPRNLGIVASAPRSRESE